MSTTTAYSTARDLRDALQYMRDHGRCRGRLADAEGRVCAEGALNATIFGAPKIVSFQASGKQRLDAAHDALLAELPSGTWTVAEYNDDTDDDRLVEMVFEDAIKQAERRECAS